MSNSQKCIECLINYYNEYRINDSKCGEEHPWYYSEIPEIIPTYFASIYGLSDDALFSSLFLTYRRSSLYHSFGTETEPSRITNYRKYCGWPLPNGESISHSFSMSPNLYYRIHTIREEDKAFSVQDSIEIIKTCAEISISGKINYEFIESLDNLDMVRDYFSKVKKLFPEWTVFINRLELF